MYDNDSSKQWNERLREAMLARDKSQTDISRATGITPAGIKKWLDGAVSKPKFDDVFDVCTYLDITPEWLMKGIGSMNDKTQPNSNMVSIQQVDYFGSCGLGVMNFEDFPEIKTLQVTPAWFTKNFSFYNPRDIKITQRWVILWSLKFATVTRFLLTLQTRKHYATAYIC